MYTRAKVGIIIPTWNTDIVLLKRCLQSIYDSDFHDYAIYIVDDGNNYDYAESLDALVTTEKIYVLHCAHAGLSGARNNGMQVVNCDYVAFVDADDVVTKSYLSQAAAILDRDATVDIACGGVAYVNARNKNDAVIYQTDVDKKYENKEKEDVVSYVICDTSANFLPEFGNYTLGSVSWKLYRYELIKDMKFSTKIKMAEDRHFNAWAFAKARKIAVVKDVWYVYYQYPNSLIHRYNPGLLENYLDIVSEFETFCTAYPQFLSSCCKWYISSLIMCFYLDLLHPNNHTSVADKVRRLKCVLKSDAWQSIMNHGFSMALIPAHNKILALLAVRKMPYSAILYYSAASKLRSMLKR